MRFEGSNKWIKRHNKRTELFPTAASRVSVSGHPRLEQSGKSHPVSAQTDKGYSKGHKY